MLSHAWADPDDLVPHPQSPEGWDHEQALVEDSLRVGEEARVALQALRQKYSAAHHAPLMAMAASTEDPALRQKVNSATVRPSCPSQLGMSSGYSNCDVVHAVCSRGDVTDSRHAGHCMAKSMAMSMV